jgi:16S rRNA (cytidine1402-2'-O)-methyltransferase
MNSGTLVLLPTPLGDIAPAEVLPRQTLVFARRIDYFLAENAKAARTFLKALEHPRPINTLDVVQIGHYPDRQRIDEWLQPIRSGRDGAIVAEAGCPGLADPGATLVARAHDLGLRVVPLIGPAAPVLTLMASGLNGQHFRFVGYLPRGKSACAAAIRALEGVSAKGETQLFIETPYRNVKLFQLVLATCAPATRLTVAIDLSTDAEVVGTRPISQWRQAAQPALAGRPCTFALLADSRNQATR